MVVSNGGLVGLVVSNGGLVGLVVINGELGGGLVVINGGLGVGLVVINGGLGVGLWVGFAEDCVVLGGDLKQTEVGVPDGDVQLSGCCSKCFEGNVAGG